jgi:hypothetical protein
LPSCFKVLLSLLFLDLPNSQALKSVLCFSGQMCHNVNSRIGVSLQPPLLKNEVHVRAGNWLMANSFRLVGPSHLLLSSDSRTENPEPTSKWSELRLEDLRGLQVCSLLWIRYFKCQLTSLTKFVSTGKFCQRTKLGAAPHAPESCIGNGWRSRRGVRMFSGSPSKTQRTGHRCSPLRNQNHTHAPNPTPSFPPTPKPAAARINDTTPPSAPLRTF